MNQQLTARGPFFYNHKTILAVGEMNLDSSTFTQHLMNNIFSGIPHLTKLGAPNTVFGRQREFAKCSSDTLILGQKDPPFKIFDNISFLPDFQFKEKET